MHFTATIDDDLRQGLRSVIRATSEGESAFHAAAAAVGGEDPRLLLLDRARRYGRAASAMRAMAREQGVAIRPESVTDAPIRCDAPARGDAAILMECERIEDAAIVAYRDALELALPPPVRAVVQREFDGLLASLGSLRALRERLLTRTSV
jgi:uncharacterized protein (TIGR02284 family)